MDQNAKTSFQTGRAAAPPAASNVACSTSVLLPSNDKKVEILLWLLRENRADIRFWQERLFFASFWLNAAILGLVGFLLREKIGFRGRIIFSIDCICLAAFHLVIVRVAKRSIQLNGTDLLTLQSGLLLNAQDQFLLDKSIYPNTGSWLPQKYSIALVTLNIILCIGSLLVIWLNNLTG